MWLHRVIYELFESDAADLDQHVDLAAHVIDREIRLIDNEGNCAFITWTWAARPPDYAIGLFDRSQFASPPQAVREMTDAPLWRPLIDKEVVAEFLDEDHQVLRLRSGGAAVYCSSIDEQGYVESDVVQVSGAIPAGAYKQALRWTRAAERLS